ncbi:phosphate ABC transporter substrate-binding protein PstS [Syntrophorhabdus aromaticivorans]|uniref:Phosphate-binding protein n=1 Tax=Syntrophorhabdus aromaticivorans TaxID=328301 RepID=A0A971M3S0_9BACT|nr:phosphate ABC transporter substrate-binding protein PstS [Syntrophorhabdus aromaticivorans]NLW34822.1 phosphate ABC transporter substrate-binding protein PstS [Syntrophorhabdus aromaticivorans]
MSVGLKKLCSFVLALGLLLGGTSLFAAEKELIGAGATFPQPLYSKMFDTYFQQNKIKVNYQGIGSGGGINQLINRTVDFGGTDAFMTAKELQAAGAAVLHIPTCLGAVVVTYNLPGNPKLSFTQDLVADIFLGKIKKWSDPAIAAANPKAKLPDLPISVVHRADGSGTTYIFSEYLSKVSKEWKEKIGTGKSLNWPAGQIGQKGNPGVAGYVRQTPGAAGYVELLYALQNKMAFGKIKNKAGIFVEPTPKSVSAAANMKIPDDTNVSLTDTNAKDGYPISSLTWLIFYKEQSYGGRSKAKAESLARMLRWMVTDGQKFVEPLQYSPLSKEAALKSEKIIKSMTYGGTPLLK